MQISVILVLDARILAAVSEWNQKSAMLAGPLVTYFVSTDKISEDDTDHNIGEMLRDGLAEIGHGRPRRADWAPSEGDLHAFVGTCRQLPVLAEIRIRKVMILAQSTRVVGRTPFISC